MINKKAISEKVLEYLQHHITLQEIVDWAEEVLMHSKFEDDNLHTVRDILARIGSADVKTFGLTWEDCEKIMNQLGFNLQVFAKSDN
jgi:cobyrinic acid a,c-diamide synthase